MKRIWPRFPRPRHGHGKPHHQHHGRRRHRRWLVWAGAGLVAVLAVSFALWQNGVPTASAPASPKTAAKPTPAIPTAHAGDLLSVTAVQTFTPAQTEALARADYGAETLPVSTGITKITFRYRSQLPTGQFITVYGRAYLPGDAATDLPIFAFAPGTTGIGDECAASLENVAKANWADYDSHMAMYASQGFAAVTTDYEGMRDPSRIHHYMIGELEGRAVLDSVRALRQLPEAKGRLDNHAVFTAGYSQGGHAAFWADKVQSGYAPDVKLSGVIGFGAVMDVRQTLSDVTNAANINWFGPYLLYSYQDYYATAYPIDQILVPRYAASLNTDVPAHCIDSDLNFWGHNPDLVYTPDFIQAMKTNQYTGVYTQFGDDLDKNAVGAVPTATPKLINSGAFDNVVLPSQQKAEAQILCGSSTGAVDLQVYPKATHYTTMPDSLADTIHWMRDRIAGDPAPGTCQ